MDFSQFLHPTYGKLHVPFNDFPNRDVGVKLGQKPTDFVAGKVGNLPYEVRNKTADWRTDIVLGEPQYYDTFDTFNCTGYANNNSAEIQLKHDTGIELNFSDEALGALAENTPQGNYLYKPADWTRNHGRILQKDWTISNPKSWQDYHQAVPLDVQKKALKFKEGSEWIDTSRASLEYHLKHAPVLIVIKAGGYLHNVVLLHINEQGLWYFDSYPGSTNYLKLTDQYPVSALKLTVKLMTNAQFVHKAGTQEYGYYLPALSPDALKDKAMNLGLPITNPDGSINFGAAKEITIKE